MTTIIENLHAMRSQIDAMIAAAEADGSGATIMAVPTKSIKAKAPKAEKAPRANAGFPTLHGAWTAHVNALHGTKSPEFLAWRAERVEMAKRGELLFKPEQAKVKSGKAKAGDPMSEADALVAAHIPWVTHWQETHPDDYATYKSTWEAANPKESRVASSKASVASSKASVASDGEDNASQAGSDAKVAKKRGPKKDSERTPEELAIVKAARAANKAKKAVAKEAEDAEGRKDANMEPASPVAAKPASVGGSVVEAAPAAEVAELMDISLLNFTHKKINYLRLGFMVADGEVEWDDAGDLWLATAYGGRGKYAGILLANNKIDNSPETLANEPQIE
uniref:Uncharacterized protein n=1 Tax=viral metagenome TaxID=1070528 RepID=A0A6C0AMC9_9ZZZZ